LLAKGAAQRGRVGPPTVPVVLNPEGAFSIGISLGSHHADIVLIDFVGAVRFHTTLANPEIAPGSNHSKFLETIEKAVALLPSSSRKRLAGVGLALPHADLDVRDVEAYFAALQEEIEEQLGVPVFVQNDITAAASGESMFGVAKPLTDYMFFYLGARLHGRLVLNHQIHNGNSPMSFDVGIAALERELERNNRSLPSLWDSAGPWPDWSEIRDWEKRLVDELIVAMRGVGQFVEIKNVVLASYAPSEICAGICLQLEQASPGLKAISGKLAPSPKAVGAASLPFSSRFMVR
jgi:hypothetical protein